MVNGRGKTIRQRLNEEIEYAKNIENIADRTLLATKALGAADIAVEFGLITYKDWEDYINRIFILL